VVRSASRGLPVIVSLSAATALAGCHTTTQQTSERLGFEADRHLQQQEPVKLGKPDRDVKVTSTSVVSADGHTAYVVALRNDGTHAVNDLPVAVGARTAGKPTAYLNLAKNTPYFQAHLPSLAPGATATFVYAAPGKPAAGTPTATVGSDTGRLTETDVGSLPRLDATVEKPAGKSGKATVEVHNPTSIQQYDLQVTAWARDGKHVVAAGTAHIAYLAGGATATVRVPLVGSPGGHRIQVAAPSTIFE
jgi:hypothetical protein